MYANFGESSAGVATPRFFPLGFSDAGAFGYLELREDPGRGGFSARLRIFDLITDGELANERELDWDHEEIVDLSFYEDTDAIAGYFLEFWRDTVADAGLAPENASHGSTFRGLPVEYAGASYFALLDKVYGGEDPSFDNLQAYDFFLRGDNETRKRIYSTDPRAVDVSASGYFASPFEPRVAVVLVEERYTFEGTEPFAVITGSNMAVGFEPVE